MVVGLDQLTSRVLGTKSEKSHVAGEKTADTAPPTALPTVASHTPLQTKLPELSTQRLQ
jgi:hypothetical protein